MTERPICTEPGCDRSIEARGLCTLHYQRMMKSRRRGNQTPGHLNTIGSRLDEIADAKAVAQEALRRARENEISDPGMAAAIMKAALRTIAEERYG